MRIRADRPKRFTRSGRTWVLVREAAAQLGVTRGRIYHLTSAGRVKTCQGPGGHMYVRADQVEAYRRAQAQVERLQRTGKPLPAGAGALY